MNIAPTSPITVKTESATVEARALIERQKKAVETFFRGLEEHQVDVCAAVLAEDVVEVVPLSKTGDPAPLARYDGKKAVLAYLGQIVQNFSRTVLVDKRIHATEDGTIFVEAKGDLVTTKGSVPYKNVYVFKFVFRSNLITHISEYANPITYAKMAGEPIG